MVDTFTPAGCGGRGRRALGLVIFAVAAVAAAAGVGALLGAIGASLPTAVALTVAFGVIALALLREARWVRLPLPEVRWQVPERWRRTLPLPVWTAGYGALLGAGFLTHQASAAFWAVCAAVLALADPVAGAACLAVFGLTRAVMIAAPAGDPLGRLGPRYALLRPANVIALGVMAVMLVPAVAAGATAATPPPPVGQADPAVAKNVIAYTDFLPGGATQVVVLAPNAAPIVFSEARQPALAGDVLAYTAFDGIRVVFWKTGQEVTRVVGPFSLPAISGPRLAYVERVPGRERLIVRNISTRVTRVLASVGPGATIGRPSVSGQLVAWHESAGDRNVVLLRSLRSRTTRLVAAGRRSISHTNPAVGFGRIAWVQSNGERSTLVIRPVSGGRVTALAGALGPRWLFWTTAIERGLVHVTRVTVAQNRHVVQRYRWAPAAR